MGKFMRKAKITNDVELPQSSLGVRTRAKTLALQKLEASDLPPSPLPVASNNFIQLRSRRLEKVVITPKSSFKQNPQINLGLISPSPTASVDKVSNLKGERGYIGQRAFLVGSKEDGVAEEEDYASFGENNLEFDGRERSTRESTPCSLIRSSDSIGTPGSSTRPTSKNVSNQQRQISVQQGIPTSNEIEEFFALAEQEQQRRFAEKYNFDVVNDVPLPGRYQWVRVYP